MNKPENIDSYIAGFPEQTRELLQQVRSIIRKTAPGAVEVISYSMPAFKLNGILVWFAGYKNHIGFYPKTSVILAFKEELSGYKCSKGTVQFPLDKPLPARLITKIVEFRVNENLAKSKNKQKK